MDIKINKSKRIYDGKVFQLIRENISLEENEPVDIEILRHPGAAAIVPLTDDNQVILIRQYRHAVGKMIWEIPAGTLDIGEEHLTCASRELAEETGYMTTDLTALGEIVPVPGYSDERIVLYLAKNLSRVHQNLDNDEYLTVHPIDFDQAVDMVYKGDIVDAKTITGLLLAKKFLEDDKGNIGNWKN